MNSDDEFRIRIPPEQRWENRVEHGHTRSQWHFKCFDYHQRCAYCGIRREETPEGWLTRDHVQPIEYGGTDKIDNIVPACKRCNFLKGTALPGQPCRGGIIPQPKPRKRFRRWW